MQSLLTIAIPTRNRCESLRKVVSEACGLVLSEGAGDQVRILVVDDNSSADKTEVYVNELKQAHGFLSYYRCDENLSFDRKLLKCLELAESKYVWTINDHSAILPGAIRRVLESLKEDYCYVFAPGKGGLPDAFKVQAISKQGLGFINTVLNTSIFNKERLLPYYEKHLPEYDGSWLVFQVANLDMLYGNPECPVLLLPFECTEYGKHMDEGRKKNTWAGSWDSYVNIGYYCARLLSEIKQKYALSDKVYDGIFRTKGSGMGACLAYMRLRGGSAKIGAEKAEVIVSNPAYSGLERAIIRGALSADSKWLFLYKALLFVYVLSMMPYQYRRMFKSLRRRLGLSS